MHLRNPLILFMASVVTLAASAAPAPDVLPLAGKWRLRLDPNDEGLSASWAGTSLNTSDRINLPGTTDLAGFGLPLDTNSMRHGTSYPPVTRFPGVAEPTRADAQGNLVRRFWHIGPAWYEREVVIPKSWKDRVVTLTIERALWKTTVWVDGHPSGSCDSLVAPHQYALGILPPGRHRLTVCVDNRMIHNITTVTHAYGPETQSQWNGMIGSIQLEAKPKVSVQSLSIHTPSDRLSLRSIVEITNLTGLVCPGTLRAKVVAETGSRTLGTASAEVMLPTGASSQEIVVHLGKPAQSWDEFHPVRYRAEVSLEVNGKVVDQAAAQFGFRTIAHTGKELRLNERPLFLRGTLDCCVYPMTGHPPMTVSEWLEILGVVKEHGFNHVRFHTWCPPEAAFEAADRLGVYLQAEVPAWVDDWGIDTVTKPGGIGRDPQVFEYLQREMRRMSEAYGNHPSFLLCAIGNEFGERITDWTAVNALVQEIKLLDPRRLYSGCAARRHLAADDFWVTHDSGAATRGVGQASTDWDFSAALKASPVPLIAHETGQRPTFPDYAALLPKFTGPLLPLNLERYQRGLAESGLAHQSQQFVEASAHFQFTQYKAEHEAMLRTRGYAGYQLLMLNDFTGQGEALVGMLDPFQESKGVITAKDIREWNAPTVVLARFPKYVWSADEPFHANLEVAHFGAKDLLRAAGEWSLTDQNRRTIARGTIRSEELSAGGIRALGEISASFAGIKEPTALNLTVRFAGARNHWNLWVYPPAPAASAPTGVLVTHALDQAAIEALSGGGRVLLLAHGLKNDHAAKTGFESVYWSAGWWGNRFSSLGIVCDPTHPALAQFPTTAWCDWQWHDLREGATTLHLPDAPNGFRPIVQPVPDFHYNALLAQAFEARVGGGSLLVCSFDLESDLEKRPAARQFRRSLFQYVASPAFKPGQELPLNWIKCLLATK